MPELRPSRRWLGRVVIGLWVLLGALGVVLAPDAEAPLPSQAELLFGRKPSMSSSARAGLLAFTRLLERLRFDVGVHASAGPPATDALLLLEPQHPLSEEESETLIRWVRQGGRLVYAPGAFEADRAMLRKRSPDDGDALEADEDESDDAGAGATAAGLGDAAADADEDAESGAKIADEDWLEQLRRQVDRKAEDRFMAAIVRASGGGPSEGPATLLEIGAGRVAVLEGGAGDLSNASLAESGIAEQLTWLRWILADVRTVAFDEGRLGLAASGGPWDLIAQSRFSSAAKLALLALFVFLVARGVRRQPALPEPPAGARAFGEHLDAVADVLSIGARGRLAGDALLQGTRRRLGVLAETPRAAATIAATEKALAAGATIGQVARAAARLQELETEIGLVADAADARPSSR